MFGDKLPSRTQKKGKESIKNIRYQTTDGSWHIGKIENMKVKGHCNLSERIKRIHPGADLAFKIKDTVTKTYFLLPICETKASHTMQYFLSQQIQKYVDKYQAMVEDERKKGLAFRERKRANLELNVGQSKLSSDKPIKPVMKKKQVSGNLNGSEIG